MFAIVQAIGWPIWPLIIASIIALALIIERSASLRRPRIVPATLLQDVLSLHARRQVTPEVIAKLEQNSPLGRVLAAALRNERAPRDIAGEAVANAGSHVAHDLSRYLTLLGSIGSIAPLLGLLGTVVGMIEIFASQQAGSSPQQLAHGISIALYCTAFGIIVAVPAVLFYRHFRTRVEDMLVDMEDQAQRLLDTLYNERLMGRGG
ncbi:MotA/TolQ/ExbB proton channel family protein [Betaproteobacteria bacterium PRO7]|nr:MotA/TolQ/ExbB proton channel family protein [Burkholderiaceae bacterium]MDL1859551.1 MotA/TolQ/ExbB proton channel family protein [Betaproteobacteria bacterium PRO7]GIL04846.1 MAG: biopolymer transporter [Betaproteobacteria bacterium]